MKIALTHANYLRTGGRRPSRILRSGNVQESPSARESVIGSSKCCEGPSTEVIRLSTLTYASYL